MTNDAPDQGQPTGGRERPSTRRGGLGRGLGALIPVSAGEDFAATATQEAAVDAIDPNPFQPRTGSNPEKLRELADSIRVHGIIQPLIVKRADVPGRFVLIAGERRWRAAQIAGFGFVPVVVKDAAPQEMLELALVENVVRADLSPLEEAAAYRHLIEEFGLTQASIAERVGRNRVTITNTLRLLSAPEPVQAALNAGQITEGHARALLGLANAADQVSLLETVLKRDYTVRQTEDAVRRWLSGDDRRRDKPAARDPEEVRLEDRFRGALRTKVAFHRSRSGAGGTLTIQYSSDEELDDLYRRLVGEDVW